MLGANHKPSARDRQHPGGWVWSAINSIAKEMDLVCTPVSSHTAVAPGRHLFTSYQQAAKARHELEPPAFPRRWFHCQRLVILSRVLVSIARLLFSSYLPASDS